MFHAKPKTSATKPRATATSRKRPDAVRDLPSLPVRLPADLRARLDALVKSRNDALAAQGASTSATALVVAAVREFVERHEAESAPARAST